MKINEILKDMGKNTYEINFAEQEKLNELTSNDIEEFYDECVKKYVSSGDNLKFSNNVDPNDSKKAILHAFFTSFMTEWKESLTNINKIKELVNPSPIETV